MAGNYTKKEYGIGPEEQTLLKDSNGTRIVPTREREIAFRYNTFDFAEENGAEPVRLSPGWEGTGRPDDELNFKGITMDQADLELNPPKDRWNIVFFIMILHGIGVLMPWNMFITAKDYFVEYKLSKNYTGHDLSPYAQNFLVSVGLCAQIPNVLFNWINIFLPLGGNLTTRIVWGIFVQVLIFVFTVILAMIDTSTWPKAFFFITIISVIIINVSTGIYQNSVFGMAGMLPGKFTGAVILGANASGAFTSIISLCALYFAPNPRTCAIYYFITALFVLLACFDTYFALPINRFYRYHEYLHQKETKKKSLEYNRETTGGKLKGVPRWKVFKQCAVQCFNVWFIFFVSLTLFPSVQSDIHRSDKNFIVPEKYYTTIMCFLTFNTTAMLGSLLASLFQWPSKKYIIIPILLRALYIPLFLVCNYAPKGVELSNREFVFINNDWVFFVIAVTMSLSSGYFSSVTMMYCSSSVEPQYSSTAGMFGSAFLVTGVLSGIAFSWVMPLIVKTIR